jgi:hypothetical protein
LAKEDQVRLSLNIPPELRSRIQDFSFLLQKNEGELVAEAIATFFNAVEQKKGEAFASALKVIREARKA